MTITAPTRAEDKPTCADPKWLKVVDAAFDHPGGPAAEILAKRACACCPVRLGCLTFAVEGNEHGPWAATSDNLRTRRRGHVLSYTHNTAGIRFRARAGDES